MTAVQKIAMGLVIVVVDARLESGLDLVPDLVGWVLALVGVQQLRPALASAGTLIGLAALAAGTSVLELFPSVLADLPPSAGWFLSLPHLAFSLVLCGAVAVALGRPTVAPEVARRRRAFLVLRWLFVVAALLPPLGYAGDADALLVAAAVVAVVANLTLIYQLFRTPASSLEVATSA